MMPERTEPSRRSATQTTPYNSALLDILLKEHSGVSIDLLAARLRLTPADIRSELERLIACGCDLERTPDSGIRLVSTNLECWLDYLHWASSERAGPTRAGSECGDGSEIHYGQRLIELYRKTTSTQDIVRRIIRRMGVSADGAIAVADVQSAGRGRLGHRWFAPPGTAVLFSRAYVIAAGETPLSVDRLILPAAVAVARAIEKVTQPNPLSVQIRWPNDLLVNDQKIAGILVETSAGPQNHTSVIGVGINVSLSPMQLEGEETIPTKKVTSFTMCNRHVDRLYVLAEAIAQLDDTLAQPDLGSLIDEWRRRNSLLSQTVRLQSEGALLSGEVVDLDPYEGLIIRTDRGELLHLNAATTTIL